MILYHGSNTLISKIDLSKGKPYKDFGRGFYATHIKEQAMQWASRIAKRYGGSEVLTILDFDYDKAVEDGLKIKIFDEPTEEWAEFVMRNRQSRQAVHDYDIVIGPVADDNMATLFDFYELRLITLAAMMESLKYKGLNSQYFFNTEQSLKYLNIL